VKNKTSSLNDDASSQFVAQHRADVIGVLSGFDRLRLRGSLRQLYQPAFMRRHLARAGVLLKDFAGYLSACTGKVRAAAEQLAVEHGRPLRYLVGSTERKETLARELAQADGIEEGLIGVWSCVEPCLTYFVRGQRATRQLELRLEPGKCLHYYFYFQHPEVGLMHLRLQTWFPFQIWVCLNGRHWLARQLDRAGIGYVQRENCFTAIADVGRARELAHAQLRTDWSGLLQPLLEECHPLAGELCRPLGLSYYWSINESEYATDVLFRSPAALAQLYPTLVQHGIRHFGSREVLRFLGRKVPATGSAHGNFRGELSSDLRHRPEGLRLKHRVGGNSLKLYDKQGSVLRVETTLVHPEQFRVYRASERDPHGPKRWCVLRRSIGDLHRRAELCAAANNRYLDALAAVEASTPAGDVAAALCRPVHKHGRRHDPYT
jgi:hypothetical protein